ncbi:glycoside hydrolase family 32 protein [Sporolactobacillus terrae]|uniref:glycoside hydrolase family 32 protein n=1 Tax=Sporolactobacillus terrae TaxID=269673 RepID=UPI00048B201E|nr:glycoside hydrolase family 32 protein [Sporolactobacillus terrae]
MNQITNDRYRQNYHIMPPKGWMNDPNGLCFFKGYYHVFFQYHPYSAEWGPMHWGHMRSMDLVHWQECPIALTPGDNEDKDGCFSGSAVVKDGRLYLIYTGHHDKENTDQKQYWQNQNLAYSEDGIHFKKYEKNPIISHPPEDNDIDFRDPKVWLENGKWFMVLGSRDQSGLGRVLLYASHDLLNWDYFGVISQSNHPEKEGYMWECPDFFQLDGQYILLTSPQGIVSHHDRCKNIFQSGYFIGDYKDGVYTRGCFREMDAGHDFYAAQTIETDDGRRILLAWMAMWENKMPEQADGWAGTMTLPRELKRVGDKLYAYPIQELKALRSKLLLSKNESTNTINFCSKAHQLEIDAKMDWRSHSTIALVMNDHNGSALISVTFNADDGKVVLHRVGPDAERQTVIQQSDDLTMKVYVDTSSFELFINHGEATFSERFYAEGALSFKISAQERVWCTMHVYELGNHRNNAMIDK